MDALSITIIVIATVTALLFKFVLFRKINRWMDQDLIKGLADGDSAKQAYLTEQLDQMRQAKIKRKEQHQRLTDLAQQYEQKQ